MLKEGRVKITFCAYFYKVNMLHYCHIHKIELSKFPAGVALLGGEGGHLPSQFFRDQRQKIPQNCKIGATFMYLL